MPESLLYGTHDCEDEGFFFFSFKMVTIVPILHILLKIWLCHFSHREVVSMFWLWQEQDYETCEVQS